MRQTSAHSSSDSETGLLAEAIKEQILSLKEACFLNRRYNDIGHLDDRMVEVNAILSSLRSRDSSLADPVSRQASPQPVVPMPIGSGTSTGAAVQSQQIPIPSSSVIPPQASPPQDHRVINDDIQNVVSQAPPILGNSANSPPDPQALPDLPTFIREMGTVLGGIVERLDTMESTHVLKTSFSAMKEQVNKNTIRLYIIS